MGLSCSCDYDGDYDNGWYDRGKPSVPPPGETCCECDAPLPAEPCQTIFFYDPYEPDGEPPPHPDDELDDEPEDANLRRHWNQLYDAMERAREEWDDANGWDSDHEMYVTETAHYRCERCEGLATALDGSKDEGGLGYCMIVPGELIEAHRDYIEMSGGAEMIWTRDPAGVLNPRRMTRLDFARREARRRISNARYFWLLGGWKVAIRYKLWPAIERRTAAPVMHALGYHRTYDHRAKRLRWCHGPSDPGMHWVRKQMLDCGFSPIYDPATRTSAWKRRDDKREVA